MSCRLFRLICFCLLLIAANASADPKTAIADDGREIILYDDGRWEYVTEDRFATTPDGTRIRLKPNQQWQPASKSEAPVYEPVALSTIKQDNLTVDGVDIVLDEVRIENHRETVGKNKRVRSNIVFYLELDKPLNASHITIQDSKGKHYPVLSVSKGKATIGGEPRTLVRAKGAPKWWGVKFFSLQIEANAIGNKAPIELRKPMGDVLTVEVKKLSE